MHFLFTKLANSVPNNISAALPPDVGRIYICVYICVRIPVFGFGLVEIAAIK